MSKHTGRCYGGPRDTKLIEWDGDTITVPACYDRLMENTLLFPPGQYKWEEDHWTWYPDEQS